MILGYEISAADNKYSMYQNIVLGAGARYSNIYEINQIDPNIKIKTKKIFHTHMIISVSFLKILKLFVKTKDIMD